ncbi:hypothetical protein AB835_09605 [Candidatus Endobugula sertula]|uniref:Protein nucleotidyltransferase YdiU n=1 Tax=Candidatus Endobugula sertula TaxID=62101 RepID=A0A1D2QP11_9GAMM|nr:hypothetical protein AB835_09605 [Candidatus Endobugula sertula]
MHFSSLPWIQHFRTLGNDFFSPVEASPLSAPYWVHINEQVANLLGTSARAINNTSNLNIFSGKEKLTPYGNIAMVYAGHQFGGYSPRLGDGRGLLIGQLLINDSILDLYLKGTGKTPYSRFGDGRAVLRSSIREYLVGEAMHALHIPTARALCIIGSDDSVIRETIETAAIVARIANTHIRFGHFEYFHYKQQFKQVKQLADHVIQQFLPEQRAHSNPYLALFNYAVAQTAMMIAKWQSVGFTHGVMNTDNMSIIGETIDYGPYGFLDDYEPGFISNHSDHYGRYAFDQQPSMGLWNLQALAESLSSLITTEELKTALAEYEPLLVKHYAELMRKKLGLYREHDDDQSICANLLQLMAKDKVDYTIFFRRLCDFQVNKINTPLAALFSQQKSWRQWQSQYTQRLALETQTDKQRQQLMKQTNPKYILRNYLVQRAIEQAQQDKDFSEIDRLMTLVQAPFEEHPEYEHYAVLPSVTNKHLPVSCSS